MPTVGLLFVKNGLWMCVGFFLIIYSGHEALEKRFPLLLYMVYCWEEREGEEREGDEREGEEREGEEREGEEREGGEEGGEEGWEEGSFS